MTVWIDVGAYRGSATLDAANSNKSLTVYALEPNLEAARALQDKAPSNYLVFALAASDRNDNAEFFIHERAEASSLLQFDEKAKTMWGGDFGTTQSFVVRTIRLDDFMEHNKIDSVDYIKIDAQGHDLAVVRGLGERIKDVREILLEVQLEPLYVGGSEREDILKFMQKAGFELISATSQTRGKEENLLFRNTLL